MLCYTHMFVMVDKFNERIIIKSVAHDVFNLCFKQRVKRGY